VRDHVSHPYKTIGNLSKLSWFSVFWMMIITSMSKIYSFPNFIMNLISICYSSSWSSSGFPTKILYVLSPQKLHASPESWYNTVNIPKNQLLLEDLLSYTQLYKIKGYNNSMVDHLFLSMFAYMPAHSEQTEFCHFWNVIGKINECILISNFKFLILYFWLIRNPD
jgi:hypothetical protein